MKAFNPLKRTLIFGILWQKGDKMFEILLHASVGMILGIMVLLGVFLVIKNSVKFQNQSSKTKKWNGF